MTRTLTRPRSAARPLTAAEEARRAAVEQWIIELEARYPGKFDRCTVFQAFDTLAERLEAHRETNEPAFFTQRQMDRFHPIYDTVIPCTYASGVPITDPLPGSGHALANRALLHGNELTIEHTKGMANGQLYCHPRACIRSVG